MNDTTLRLLEEIKERNNGATQKLNKLISEYSFILNMANVHRDEEAIESSIKIISKYHSLLRILREDNEEMELAIKNQNDDEVTKYLENNKSREEEFTIKYGETINLNQKLVKEMDY